MINVLLFQYVFLFFIIPASVKSRASSLFATHPPLEQRLERLAEIAREMGRPVA